MTTKTSSKKARDSKQSKTIVAIIASSIIAILIVIIGSVIYVTTSLSAGSSSSASTTQSSSKDKNGSFPTNPSASATKWLTTLMTDTSDKFGEKFFSSDSTEISQLMAGDVSFIPKSIRDRVETGNSRENMTVSRDTLTGASYAGLLIYSNAYAQTLKKKITVAGNGYVSYDSKRQVVYIPAQAVLSTDKDVVFEVAWNGSSWKLVGDTLGWNIYVMVQQQQAAAANSSSESGK